MPAPQPLIRQDVKCVPGQKGVVQARYRRKAAFELVARVFARGDEGGYCKDGQAAFNHGVALAQHFEVAADLFAFLGRYVGDGGLNVGVGAGGGAMCWSSMS